MCRSRRRRSARLILITILGMGVLFGIGYGLGQFFPIRLRLQRERRGQSRAVCDRNRDSVGHAAIAGDRVGLERDRAPWLGCFYRRGAAGAGL